MTGSNGFIGSQLLNRLTKENALVFGWDSGSKKQDSLFAQFLTDLGDFRPEVIFHVGANSNTLATQVNDVLVSNYLFTKELMEWANQIESMFIYSSSAACFGVGSGHPENLYGWSKLLAEDFVRLSGGISLRYFNVYGPGEEHKESMASFVYQAWKAMQAGRRPRLFPGKPRRDFIHVADIVSANLAAANLGEKVRSKSFEVGTGRASTFEDCMNLMGIAWDYTSPDKVPYGYQFFTKANTQNFLPNWAPQFSLETGLTNYRDYLERDSQ